MREAGQVVGATLQRVMDAVEPGVSLAELDAIGAACIREHGARSSFLGYLPHFADTPYPATLCLSVNDVVVHGVPDGRVLRDGDIVSIEGGADDPAHRPTCRGRRLPDRWSVATADGSRAAHFEHTVAVTADGTPVASS